MFQNVSDTSSGIWFGSDASRILKARMSEEERILWNVGIIYIGAAAAATGP